jgi:acyl transferase domain-containing protein
MNTGRDHFACRAAVVASDAASLRDGLARIAEGSSPAAAAAGRRGEPRVAFVFEEFRALPGMARELFQAEQVFRAALERAAEIAGHALGAELLPALLDAASARLEFPQTSGLVVQHALHALLARFGITPSIVFGSGTGEYAAACVAGALAWRDALQVVARRELLLSSLVPGARVRQTLSQFKTRLASTPYMVPALPLVVAGLDRRIASDETLGAKYWLDHLYARPEAARGLGTLRELEPELVVSFGPAQPGAERAEWLSCLGRDGHDLLRVLETVAKLYERGATIDFPAFHAGFEREKLGLPSYPFQRKRCWLDLEPEPVAKSTHPFLRANPR